MLLLWNVKLVCKRGEVAKLLVQLNICQKIKMQNMRIIISNKVSGHPGSK